MKALVLASVARERRKQVLDEFRGSRAHNIEWLGALFRRHVRAAIPRDVTRHLSRVSTWTTDLRYATGSMRHREADQFMESVVVVATWADGRM